MIISGIIFAALISTDGTQNTNCNSLLSNHAEIHWSDNNIIFSPDCKMSVEVSPSGSDAPATVYLKNINKNSRKILIKLSRDGGVFWSPNSNFLFIEDKKAVIITTYF